MLFGGRDKDGSRQQAAYGWPSLLRLVFLDQLYSDERIDLMGENRKRSVLFLCTGNSCRSQMAEGWARQLWPDSVEAHSAGVKPSGLNPDAVKVMTEAGIDISQHQSKHLHDLKNVSFDYVVTVCDDAHEACPVFPGDAKVLHRAFDDPPRLAKNAATEEQRLAPYRRVRDEIKEFVQTLPEALETANSRGNER